MNYRRHSALAHQIDLYKLLWIYKLLTFLGLAFLGPLVTQNLNSTVLTSTLVSRRQY
jgi:hypothetical protein